MTTYLKSRFFFNEKWIVFLLWSVNLWKWYSWLTPDLHLIAYILQCLYPGRPLAHQDAQESKHLRLLLPLCYPAVQGGLRHHGRRQGWSSLRLWPHSKYPEYVLFQETLNYWSYATLRLWSTGPTYHTIHLYITDIWTGPNREPSRTSHINLLHHGWNQTKYVSSCFFSKHQLNLKEYETSVLRLKKLKLCFTLFLINFKF